MDETLSQLSQAGGSMDFGNTEIGLAEKLDKINEEAEKKQMQKNIARAYKKNGQQNQPMVIDNMMKSLAAGNTKEIR